MRGAVFLRFAAVAGSAPGKMQEAFALSAASKSDGIPPPKRGSILDSLRGHRDSIQGDDTKRSSRLGSLHAELLKRPLHKELMSKHAGRKPSTSGAEVE